MRISRIKQKHESRTYRTQSLHCHQILPSPHASLTEDTELKRLKVQYANLQFKYDKLKKMYESEECELKELVAMGLTSKKPSRPQHTQLAEIIRNQKRNYQLEEQNKTLKLEVEVIRQTNKQFQFQIQDLKEQLKISENANSILNSHTSKMHQAHSKKIEQLQHKFSEKEKQLKQKIDDLTLKIQSYEFASIIHQQKAEQQISSQSHKRKASKVHILLQETLQLIQRRVRLYQRTYEDIYKSYFEKYKNKITILKLIDQLCNYEPWALNFSQVYPLLFSFYGGNLMFKTEINLPSFFDQLKLRIGQIHQRQQLEENRLFDSLCLKFSANIQKLKLCMTDRPDGFTGTQLKNVLGQIGVTSHEEIEYVMDKLAVCSQDMGHLQLDKWLNAIEGAKI